MPDIKWIKITTEMFDDEKIRIIEAMPEADTLIVIWIRLICMAGKVNAGGHIFLAPELPYSEEQLASVLNRPLNTVRLALETFKYLQMVHIDDTGVIFLPNFEKHQNVLGMERIREDTKKRVANFRERARQKLLLPGEAVTLRNVTVTQQNRIDKNRIDKNRKGEEEEKNNSDFLNTLSNEKNDENNGKAQEIWAQCLEELKKQVNRSNYRTWLEETTGLSYEKDQFVIGVPNAFIAEYLDRNQRSLIEKVLTGIISQEVQVQFRVNNDHQSPATRLQEPGKTRSRQAVRHPH